MRKVKIEIELRVQPHEVRAAFRLIDDGDEVGVYFEYFSPEEPDARVKPQLDVCEKYAYLNDSGEIFFMDDPLKPRSLGSYIEEFTLHLGRWYEMGRWNQLRED